MNNYCFENFNVGEQAEFETEITAEKMEYFLNISGDVNPLHTNEAYAVEKGFCSRVVYGMLTASMYSTLAGVYLPGEKCILKSVETYFQNPAYVGDVLKVSGRVKDKDDRFKQATIKAKIVNQHGKIISKANILVGFYE